MAGAVFQAEPTFAIGASLLVWPDEQVVEARAVGPSVAGPVTVGAGGVVSFAGLDADRRYAAGVSPSGPFVHFRADPAPSELEAVDVRLDAIEDSSLWVAPPTGIPAVDYANLSAAIAALSSTGGKMTLGFGSYDIGANTLTFPVNTPIAVWGAGYGRPLLGGTRIVRSSGTNPVISAIGTGNTDATRVCVDLQYLMLHGGGLAGTVLKLQRANDSTLRNVRVGWSAGTGCQFSQLWNCEIDVLRVHNCGNGTTSPAVLFDGINGAGAQGASDTVNCSNWQLEGNSGTPLRLTGSVGDAGPTTMVQMVNLKIEGSGGAWPQIDLDYAQACKFTNVHISNVDSSTVALIRQTGTNTGARANQFENLSIETIAPTLAYFIDHGVGALSISNANLLGVGAGFVAFVAVRSTVASGDFNIVGATTNFAGKLVDDQRSPKGRYERLRGVATWNPPSVASGAATSTTVTVTGARAKDVATAAFEQPVPGGCLLNANVTANDTVTVTLANFSGGAVDLASGALGVDVLR